MGFLCTEQQGIFTLLDARVALVMTIQVADAETVFLGILQAHNLIGEIEDPQLTLQYKACYARICDCKRKFLEAATHYYDLSQSGPGVQCALSSL